MKLRLAIIACLLFAALPAAAGSPVPVKNWVFQDYGADGAGAWTNNESGSSLGLYCSSKASCFTFVGTDTDCESGTKYTAMMNSDGGVLSVAGTCSNIAGADAKPRYVLVLDNFDRVVSILLQDHTVGFAVPLASGNFKVMHFSLDGSNEAIGALRRSTGVNDRKATARDQVL